MDKKEFKPEDFKKGMRFTCILNDRPAEGVVQIEDGNIYLCQDAWDGFKCEDKLGHKYSYVLTDGSELYLAYMRSVQDLVLIPIGEIVNEYLIY